MTQPGSSSTQVERRPGVHHRYVRKGPSSRYTRTMRPIIGRTNACSQATRTLGRSVLVCRDRGPVSPTVGGRGRVWCGFPCLRFDRCVHGLERSKAKGHEQATAHVAILAKALGLGQARLIFAPSLSALLKSGQRSGQVLQTQTKIRREK